MTSTKQAYNLAMLGARTLKHSRDVSSDQKMKLRAKVMVKVTLKALPSYKLVSNAMCITIQVSDIGPSWHSCRNYCREMELLIPCRKCSHRILF